MDVWSMYIQFLICIVIAGGEVLSNQNGNGICKMGRDSYSVGSTWHPHFVQSGYDYCTLCLCLNHDDIRCERIQCPVMTCERVKSVPGQCCKQCTDSEENSTIGGNHSYGREEEAQCHHGGDTYKPGESFTLQKLNSVRPNQCTQCTCMDGKVQCGLRTCIPVPCEEPLFLPMSCCPICPNEEEAGNSTQQDKPTMRNEVSNSDLEIGGMNKEDNLQRPEEDKPINATGGSCKTDNGLFIHGQRWHPNVYPFGLMKCIVCHCMNGKANCSTVVCRNEDLRCSNPVVLAGQCCQTCPEINKVPYGNKPSIIAEPPMCLRPRENVLVYSVIEKEKRSTAKGYQVSYIIQQINEKTVEEHQWVLNSNGTIRNFLVYNISLREFAELLTTHPDRHTLEGATKNHKLRKLLNKEQEIFKNCKINCRKQVRRITKVLRARTVTRQEHCPYSITKSRKIRNSKASRG